MNKRWNPTFDEPAVDGPDYVALVIEWEQTAIPDAIEDQITTPTASKSKLRQLVDKTQPVVQPVIAKVQPVLAKIVHAPTLWKAAGAAGVLALAGWGVHRLRAA